MRFSDIFIPREFKFVELITAQAEVAVKAMTLLDAFMTDPSDKAAMPMTLLEADGDAARKTLVDALSATFVTPIDREDLFELSRAVDDIVDQAEATMLEMILYEVEPNPYLVEMVRALRDATVHARGAVASLRERPEVAETEALEARRLEKQVESLTRYALYRLFREEDVGFMMRSREIYRHVAECATRRSPT